MAIKSILFDFNGVIVNDEPLHMKAFQEIFGEQGIVLTEEGYYSQLGADDRTFIEETFRRAGKAASAGEVEAVRSMKSEKYQALIADEIPLFPGADNFVRSCANYFALGIVSMAPRGEIEEILTRLDLRKCFSLIVSAEDVDRPKPDPRCYKLGFVGIDNFRINNLNFPPMSNGECLAIEDSPTGVEAAKGAALKTLGVTNTVPAHGLRSAGADMVTYSLEDWTPMAVEGAFR
jgi:HAD superfamily hydrolase (TIGR01509 family)